MKLVVSASSSLQCAAITVCMVLADQDAVSAGEISADGEGGERRASLLVYLRGDHIPRSLIQIAQHHKREILLFTRELFLCSIPTMTTFISYQPRRSVPAFMSNDTCASGPVDFIDCVLWSQSRRARERSNMNGGVDLLGRVGSAQPYEATPESLTVQETPQASEVDSVGECDEDAQDFGDHGYCSDDSELPSLEELLSQPRGRSGTSVGLNSKTTTVSEQPEPIDRQDGCSASGSETRASPGIDAAEIVFSRGDQDNPIVLDESEDEHEHDRQRGVSAPDHRGDPNLDTASSVDRRDSSLRSIVPTFTDGVHGPRNSTGGYTFQNSEDREEGRKKYKNNRSRRESGCANEELVGSSEGREIPASAGHIHDIFADYEQRFSIKKLNQQPQKQRTTRHSSTRDDSDQAIVSSSSVRQSVHDDGSQTASARDAGIDENAHMVDDDLGLRRSSEASTAGEPTSQPRQDSEGQSLSNDDVRLDGLTPIDASQEPSSADSTSLPHHETMNDDAECDSGLPLRNPSTRKRRRQSPESIPIALGHPPSKRPRRVTKESWKAREAREQSEAKQTIVSAYSRSQLRPRVPKPVAHARLTGDGNERNNQIADVEDVYLAEDGSIQCVVRWKASLVAKENLASESLRRRCEALFKKKYGAPW